MKNYFETNPLRKPDMLTTGYNISDLFFRAEMLNKNIPKIDLHIHTNVVHGRNSIEELARQATKEDLEIIAFTEHARKDSTYISAFLEEIMNVRQSCNIRILSGVECRIINTKGDVDTNDNISGKVDIVLGALHKYPSDVDYEFIATENLSHIEAAEIETEATLNAIKKSIITSLAHPTRIYSEHFDQRFPKDMLIQILRCCTDNGVAFELNAQTKYLEYIMDMCIKENALISIGSDAHSIEQVGLIVRMLESLTLS